MDKDKILGKNFSLNNWNEYDKNKLHFIYGNNGSGKTTLINKIRYEDKNNFEFFSYETIKENLFTSRDIFKISKNVARIEKLRKENDSLLLELKIIIHSFFKDSLSSGNNWYKNNKTKTILNMNLSNIILTKTGKAKEIEITYENIRNLLNKINEIKINETETFEHFTLLKELDKNYFDDFSKYDMNIIENCIKNNKNIIDELTTNTNINFYVLKEIFSNIENLEEMNNCYICDTEISNFDEIKKLIKLKIEKESEKLNENSSFKELTDMIEQITKNNKDDYIKEFKSNINRYFFNDKELNKLKLLFEKHIHKSEELREILENGLAKEIVNIFGIEKLEEIIQNHNELKELLNGKEIINKKLIELIETILDQHVEKRVKINRKEYTLKIDDDENIENARLSTGEKNFFLIAFSLLIKINKIIEKKNAIIFIDDPISSVDSEFRYQILLLINTIFKEFKSKIQIFIFTHSTVVLKTQLNSSFNNGETDYFLLKTVCGGFDEDDLGLFELEKDEINLINFPKTIEKIREILENSDKENTIIIIFLILPLLRCYSYLWDDEDAKSARKEINKIFHYELEEKIEYDIILQYFKKMFEYKKDDIDKDNLEDKIKQILKNFNISKDINENLKINSSILKKTLTLFYFSYYLKYLIWNNTSNEFKEKSVWSQIKHLKKINGNNIDDKDLENLLLSSKDLICDSFHCENNFDYYCPGLEFSKKQEKQFKKMIQMMEEKYKNE